VTLQVLANELGVTEGAVRKIEAKAYDKVEAARGPVPFLARSKTQLRQKMAEFYVEKRPQRYTRIDRWLDLIKEKFPQAAQKDRLEAWRIAGDMLGSRRSLRVTQEDRKRIKAKRPIVRAAREGDYILRRVARALAEGRPTEIPTTTADDQNWNPLEHITRLVRWRLGTGNEHTAWWNLSARERQQLSKDKSHANDRLYRETSPESSTGSLRDFEYCCAKRLMSRSEYIRQAIIAQLQRDGVAPLAA
jgi:hypothetical protein